MLSYLPVDNQKIQYLLKEPEVGKIVVSMDQSPPELNVYQRDGIPVPEKEKDAFTCKDSKSVVVKHKLAKRKYKFNKRTRTLEDLSNTITVDEYNESKEDAAYLLRTKEPEPMRIRISDSE